MQPGKFIVLIAVCTAAGAVALLPRQMSAHHASLSDDLRAFEASHSSKAIRVIAHGGDADVSAVAARHGVRVVRPLDDGAVLEATATQIEALSADPAIQHLSGDLRVGDFMTVSTATTLADKVRSGDGGGLLGLGEIPGATTTSATTLTSPGVIR